MHLPSDRLPLLAAPATSFALEVLVRNSSTLLARNVNLTIEVPAEFSVAQRSLGAGDLPPGAERRLRFEASTSTSARTTAFSLECDWEDEYDREGDSRETFHAEAQRES
jgi:hypothetical protein